MKKTAFVAIVSALTVLMVLPAIRGVNHPASCVVADGQPLPPFAPSLAPALVADGWPSPPFPPQLRETALSA